jgi:GNAT superfamily N-acetyltransferase
LVTNLFPARQKLQRWIERGLLFGLHAESAVVLLLKDKDFSRLYFTAPDAASLDRALGSLDLPLSETVVADLVGKPAAVADLVRRFERYGFSRRASLCRLLRMGSQRKGSVDCRAGAAPAEQGDSAWIVDSLQSYFDCLVEQIPDSDEIAEAIGRGNVIVSRDGERPAGFLFYEKTGLTATLRYWFVDPAYRDRGVGSALMHAFLDQCPDVKRILLWVLADNENAIRKYEHYEFAREGLVDHVVIRERRPR